MFRRRLSIILVALVTAPAAHVLAQDSDQSPQESRRRPGHRALNLGISGTGVSFGNSRSWNGLRINWQDNAVEQVNGITLTLWTAKHNEDMVVNGFALGVAGPVGGRFNGLTIGIVGAVAEQGFNGITLAGVGAVSNGNTHGVTIAGLGVVSNGDMAWVNISGLGTVANRSMLGLNVAGLGLVANGDMQGINVSGLGTVANGALWGLNLGGLAVVGNGSVRGISLGGLAVVSNGSVDGVHVGGLAVVGNGRVRGAAIGGLAVVSNGRISGLAVGGLAVVGSDGLVGVGIGGAHVEAQLDSRPGHFPDPDAHLGDARGLYRRVQPHEGRPIWSRDRRLQLRPATSWSATRSHQQRPQQSWMAAGATPLQRPPRLASPPASQAGGSGP